MVIGSLSAFGASDDDTGPTFTDFTNPKPAAGPYPKPGERLCPVAQDILNRTTQPIPDAAPHPTSTMGSGAAFILVYPALIQAGILTERSAPGEKRVVVDSAGRLLPYSDLISSDPENSAGVTAAAELLAIQLRVPGSY